MINLETERVILYPLDSINLLLSLESFQELEKRLGVTITDRKLDEEMQYATKVRLKKVLEDERNYLWLTNWAIISKDKNCIVGFVTIKGCPNDMGEVTIEYGIEKEYRGNGYATEAVKKLIKWIFISPRAKYVIVDIDKVNTSSHRVLEKVGAIKYKETDELLWWKVKNTKLNEVEKLIEIIELNKDLIRVFDALDKIGLVEYYVGAGALAQNVWNIETGRSQNYGISDVDIIYFNPNMLEEDETKIRKKLEKELGNFPVWLDVKNQARVHLWYKEKFGYEIETYKSLEDAIKTWPTTSTSFGVQRERKNKWNVYAPYGLRDIFEMRVKANPIQITEAIYMNKVQKWTDRWPELEVVEWSDKNIEIVNTEVISIVRK
ncbi:nucleotidyltransferase family protein [Helicovermis profundi]|uniref:N-acetyltransferase domain-containing protein n=1 Tax=Helicovermis profundi TaxID=3065157 RepID=A0AAU9E0U6_9FIRM|nr:hypothetical protein HLPR_05020 [Clostridia bacterium S502]